MSVLSLHRQQQKAIKHYGGFKKTENCYEEKNFAMRKGAWTIPLNDFLRLTAMVSSQAET